MENHTNADHDDHTEHHRDVQGGAARATVFGVSDGLVSNVSLILGVAGADVDASVVRLAGLAGLLAGAISMAAGEYVSMRAQTELLERELEIERQALINNPEAEILELAEVYVGRGVDPDLAEQVARQLSTDPETALDVHAREELGVDPDELGSAVVASVSSFAAFCVGAIIPLIPWFLADGGAATWLSIVLSLIAAGAIGAVLAGFTGKSVVFSASRQILIAAVAAGSTYLIGSLVGTSI